MKERQAETAPPLSSDLPGAALMVPGTEKRDGRRRSLYESFFARASIGGRDACWEWRGSISKQGYGYLYRSLGSKPRHTLTIRIHRLAYEIAHNTKLESHQYVHHICRNRRCVNPRHLELTDAHRHMLEHLATHCKRGHAFTRENTYTKPNGKRVCLACRRLLSRKRDRERWITDPEWREKKLLRKRNYYHRMKGKRLDE